MQLTQQALSMEKDELLHMLQAHAFVMRDVALYLDTHPEDKEAMSAFTKHKQAYQACSKVYADRFGALCMEQTGAENGWLAWSNTPWPWEKEAN